MPSRSHRAPLALLCLLLSASPAAAEKLHITSDPPGATVEINGVPAGTTPLDKDFPGGYFHRTRTTLGARLQHALIVRVTLKGYATKEMLVTEGPMTWIALNGRNHGDYFLIKSDRFHLSLEPISQVFTGALSEREPRGSIAAAVIPASGAAIPMAVELSLEEIVRRAKPAVVFLKGLEKSGTGFFVTETGVIATNAHVARGEESLLALLPDGRQLEARVVYVDADLDIALAKIDAQQTPSLPLAEAAFVRQGENVIAIGNPGDAMLFSVTKGIVSAVGRFGAAGPGTWIQTDTPINPGNSGGPLVNSRGEVIGINTQKLVKKNVNGIGFALSATDLLAVLHRFYPAAPLTTVAIATPQIPPRSASEHSASSANSAAITALSPIATTAELDESAAPVTPLATAAPEGTGTIVVTSDPDNAEIYIDDKFVGSAPATLKLPQGTHIIVIKSPGYPEWRRIIEILKSSKVSLKANLDGNLR